MNISRQKLYALGEPLGESATRKQGGRVVYGGGGGGSSSSSSTTNENYNIDNRMAIGNGSIAANGQSTITTIDPGALRAMELAMVANTENSMAAMEAANKAAENAAKAMAAQAQASAQAQAATTGQAFSFAAGADATNKAGFSKLLDTSFDMFEIAAQGLGKAFDSTARTQELTAAAYQTATAEKSGSIDNKTIMVIAVAGAAAMVMMRRR